MNAPPTCPYCQQPAKLMLGAVVYKDENHRLADKYFWRCEPCDAQVGCHDAGDGTRPLGTLADSSLRGWRMSVHALFDPLWQQEGMTRVEAYRWLGSKMRLPPPMCHVAMFNEQQCRDALHAIRMYWALR